MQIRWDLLGAPVNVGGAIQQGFERGMVRGAFSDLASDPTNESALSRLAMFDPQSALAMRDRARQETFRTSMRSAFDPETGQVDPVRARSAFAEAGDIEGAIEFDRNRATTQRTQQTADRERLLRMARLLDDSTDEASYRANRETAIRALGANATDIPEAYDPAWVEQQRRLVSALTDEQEMTTFMRDATAAGIAPGSPEFRRMLEQRYAAPPRIVTGPNGELMIVGGGGAPSAGGGAPPELTDEDIRRLEGGAGQPGPQTFPQ